MFDLTARKRRWQRLLAPQGAPGFCFFVHYADPDFSVPALPPQMPQHAAVHLEHKWRLYQHELAQAAWLDDDRIPALNMMTGTEIFAEALGCPVHRPADNNPFALPAIHSAAEVERIRVPELSHSTLAYLFEIADALKARAGQGTFKVVDVQSPMDIAALVLEKAAFFEALYDAPEAVKALAAKARHLLTGFFDEWFRRYGTEFVAHYPEYFMSGGITLSEDEIGCVNAEMFEEFFSGELAALSHRYGGIGIHCCADARHQWESLRRVPGLRMLNFVNPPTRTPEEYTKQAYPFFRDTCAQWMQGWVPAGEPATWPDQYPAGCRFVIEAYAKTKEDAIRMCADLQAARARLYG